MILKRQPKVSIVVAVYNGERTLEACLDSLMALDFPAEDREIIVVDNNSTDASKEIIARYPVIYLYEPHRGRGWARNQGIRHAAGEFIAFTDADCVVTKEWLTVLLSGFGDNENVAVCGGEIFAFKQETVFERYCEARGILNQKKGIEGQNPEDLPRAVTANAAFRKRVLEEADYFDEDMVTSEDTEISWRISFLGYEIKYVPEAIVYHQHTRTFWQFCKHHFEFGKAGFVLSHKYRKLYLGFEGTTSSWQGFLLIIKAFFILSGHAIRNVILNVRKERIPFLFFDTLVRISYNLGSFAVIAQTHFLKTRGILPCKIPLERFYRTLTIQREGRQWSFDHPATWFLNNAIVRLVVFHKGLHTYKFNRTATRMWQSLVCTRDIDATVDALSALYRVPREVIKKDADSFISMLEDERVLKMTAQSPVIACGVSVS